MASAAFATGSGITYQGQIFQPSGAPLSGQVSFELEIYTPSPSSCLMYEEMQTITVGSDGAFSLTIDDGTGTRLDSSGYTLDQIFANLGTFSFASGCLGSNSYTPDASEGRVLNVLFKSTSMSSYESVGAQNINFIPMALTAKNVGGFASSNLLRFQESNGTMDSVSPLNNAQYNALVSLVNGTSNLYLTANSNGAVLPSVASAPSSPAAGTIWYNTSSGSLQYEGSSGVQTLGTAGGSVTLVAAGTGLSGGPITSSGTLSLASLGAGGTGTKLTFDSYGRVTASATLSASDIPTLSAAGQVMGSAITSGTIAGSTAFNTSGNVTTTGTLTAQAAIATSGDFNNLIVYKSDNSEKVTITASNGQASNYGLTLPTTAGSAGQILSTDGAGVLSWLTPSSGSVTSVVAGTGLNGGTITGAGTLSLASSGVSSGSYGSATQVPLLTVNAQGQITAASNVTISGVAPSGAASGDLSGTYPSPLVAKIQGVSVNSQTPLDGQYLKYVAAGLNYLPHYVSFADLKSSAGLTQIPSTCTSSQTLAYQSPSDTFACVAIALSDSAVTYTSKSANTFLAAPNGSSGTPSFRSIATADLGSGAASSSTYLRGDGSWASVPTTSAAGSSGQIQFNSASAFAAAPSLFWDNTNSRLGIGTSSPSKTFSVYSSTSPALSLVDGSQGVGKVLTSDASGNASWAAVTASATSFSGTLAVANGGTGQSSALTQGGLVYGSSSTAMATTAAGSSGGVLVSGGAGAPSFVTTTLSNTAMTFAGAGLIATTGTLSLTGGNVGIGTTSANSALEVSGTERLDGSTSGYVALNAPASPTSYTLTLPAAAPASNGQVLTGTTAGALSWTSALTSSLASGDLFVGNSSGLAAAVAPTGDVSLTNAGVFTVAKVNGVSYPSGATTVNTVPVVTSSNAVTYEALPNAALANSSVTLGSTSVSLGGTTTSLAGLTSLTSASHIFSNGSNTVTVTAPSAGVTAYTLTLPAAAPSVSGQVLSATTAGLATWTTVSASAANFTGTLAVSNGGTGQASSLTPGGIIYGSSSTAMGTSAASTAANQVLVGETTGSPSFVTTTLTNTAMTFAGNGTISTGGTLALTGSNVGIGTTTPTSKLQVNGAISNAPTTYSSSFTCGTSTIDFSTSNFINFSPSNTIAAGTCTMTLSNMVSGGSYTLVVTGNGGTNAVTYSFGGYTFKYLPTNAATTAGKDTIYTFLYNGTTVYVTWSSGY
jgi:hypothetical protein